MIKASRSDFISGVKTLVGVVAVAVTIASTLYWCTGVAPQAPQPGQPRVRHSPLMPPVPGRLRAGQVLPASDPTNTGNWIPYAPMTDEFNNGSIDTVRWRSEISYNGWNTNFTRITVGPDPLTGDQAMGLTMTSTSDGVVDAIIGGLFPDSSIGQWTRVMPNGYGYYETRMRGSSSGATSGFYVYGNDQTSWTAPKNHEVELDVNDGCFGATANATPAHTAYLGGCMWAAPGYPKGGGTMFGSSYCTTSPSGTNSDTPTFTVPTMSTAYHTYGLDVEHDTITWYIDGVQRYQCRNNYQTPGTLAPGCIFNTPVYAVFESSWQASWNGAPAGTLPGTTYYDYIRVWTKGGTEREVLTPPERLILTPLGPEVGRSGQER